MRVACPQTAHTLTNIRELLLLEGITLQGLGNWQAVSEHVGTRTKEEVEKHYYSVYIDSPAWPLPVRQPPFSVYRLFRPYSHLHLLFHCLQRMDIDFEVDPAEFHERKRRRISSMTTNAPPPHKVAPVSAPGVHEVATFLPGRLEFEHELDNEAEDIVKDLEFGICLEWGGDQIPEDENDQDVKGRAKWADEMKAAMQAKDTFSGKRPPNGLVNGVVNGYHSNGDTPRRDMSSKPDDKKDDEADDGDEQTQPPPYETQESLAFKLALLESYYQRVEKRHEAKSIMFDRGLLNYKQVSPISAFVAAAPLTSARSRRKWRRRGGSRTTKTSFIGCGRSHACRRRRILSSFKRTSSVRTSRSRRP